MSEVDFKPVTSAPTGDFERTETLPGRICRQPSDRQSFGGTRCANAAACRANGQTQRRSTLRTACSRRAASSPIRRSWARAASVRHLRALKEHAAKGEYPNPPDNFRWRFFGLFYVAPNQNSYMCRLRIPNGIVKAQQFAGLADLAERYGGGYAHVTTRANIQIREVEAANAVAMIEAIQDLGLCSRGSGADNIRNVTGTPTAGIDPQDLSTRPYTRMAFPSSTTVRSTACRASSTSPSMAPVAFPSSRIPMTSASRRLR
jgi:hypothetical protein